MDSLFTQIEALTNAQQEREATVAKQLEACEAREKMLAEKEKTLAESQSQLDAYRKSLLELETKLGEKSAQLEAKETSLKEKRFDFSQSGVYNTTLFGAKYIYTASNGKVYYSSEPNKQQEIISVIQKEQELFEKESFLNGKEEGLKFSRESLNHFETRLKEKETELKAREDKIEEQEKNKSNIETAEPNESTSSRALENIYKQDMLNRKEEDLKTREEALKAKQSQLASYEHLENLLNDALCGILDPKFKPSSLSDYILTKIQLAEKILQDNIPPNTTGLFIDTDDKYFMRLTMDDKKNKSSVVIPVSEGFANHSPWPMKRGEAQQTYGHFTLRRFDDDKLGLCDLVSNPPQVIAKFDLKTFDLDTLIMWARFTNNIKF